MLWLNIIYWIFSVMINNKKIVTNERLEKAFKMFDKDNSGRLFVDEIISVL